MTRNAATAGAATHDDGSSPAAGHPSGAHHSGSARAIDQYARPHETANPLFEVRGNDVICSGDDTPDGETDEVVLVFELPKGRRLKSIELYNGKHTPDFDGEASFVRLEVNR